MSFFSQAGENRRLKRGGAKRASNLLEVSARPEKEGMREIRRRVSIALKIILGVSAVGALLFFGRTGVRYLFWENPAYAISDLRVSTDGMLTRAQVLELLGLEEGRNIFSVNVDQMKATLDALPQVERAEVRRMLPDRVEIRIVERQPIAWVAATAEAQLGANGQAYLVDARGYALRTRKVLPEYWSLPLIVGVNLEDVAPGQRLPTAEMLAAVELLRLSADETRWMPRVVDVSKGYCLLVTDQRKARVTFGFDNLEEQLNRLRQLLETVEPMQRDLQTVNLMLERNVPVTFAPPAASALPAADPKAKAKTTTSKTSPASGVNPLVVTAEQIAKAQAAAVAAPSVVPPRSGERTGGVLVTLPPPKSVKETTAVVPGVLRELPREAVKEAGKEAKEIKNGRESRDSKEALTAAKLEVGGESVDGGSVQGEDRVAERGERGGRVEAGSASGSGTDSKPEVLGKGAGVKLSGGEVGEESALGGSPSVISKKVAPVVPVVPAVSETPPRAIPVKRNVPAGGGASSSGGSSVKSEPAKPESSKSESAKPVKLLKPVKPEVQPSKSAPLPPDERLRKMFQPHA